MPKNGCGGDYDDRREKNYGHSTEIEPALRFLSNFAY